MKKMIAAGGLVFNSDNELLMIFRRNKWDLPKGKLDEGETIEECAVREVQEETGLQLVELKDKLGTTLHTYTEKGVKIEKESHWFTMFSPGNQPLIPQTEEDITSIEWVSKEKLAACLQNTYGNIADIIARSGW